MDSGSARPRVIVADDHAHVHGLIRRILEPDLTVVGDVFDGGALIAESLRLLPDLLVVDVFMPVLNGVEAVPLLLGLWPRDVSRPRVVFVSTDDGAANVERAMRAGGAGLVRKASAAELLLPAARA